MYLAVDKDRPATIAAIAKTYRISETHLMKVVHQLGIAGDIATTRGRKGGIRLAKAPDSINLGPIIRRTEADMELVPCFGDARNCAIEDVCRLRTVLAEALKAFLAVLDQASRQSVGDRPECTNTFAPAVAKQDWAASRIPEIFIKS